MSKPYTYLIGWSELGKWYYGVRYSKDCSPDDLWADYFTSSKVVTEMRGIHGEPDVVAVRKKFSVPEQALAWEQKVLRRLNVLRDDRWLNQNIGGDGYVKKQTSDHVRKRTQNKKHNPNQRSIALNALAKAVAANTGRKQSEETQRKKRETYYRNRAKRMMENVCEA